MAIRFDTVPDPLAKDFGTIVRGRSFWGEVLAHSTAGDGWSLFILFRDHIVKRGRWSVHEVNLQTGVVTPHYGTENEPSHIFSLPDGRVYVPMGPIILRLNPDTGEFDEIQVPKGFYWYWRPARDGTVFLCSTDARQVLQFDPAADTFVELGQVGHGQGTMLARMWEYGDVTADGEILTPIAVDDRYLYVVTGQLPRTLWSLDLETREQCMLLCIADPDRMALAQHESACYALVHRPGGPEAYRLAGDTVEHIPSLPTREVEPVPTVAGVPRPDIPERLRMPVCDYQGTGMCEANGKSTVYYRPQGEGWKTVIIDLSDYPTYLFKMGVTRDGRLVCSTEDPYTIFVFDPRSEKPEILGPSPYYTHTYGFSELNQKIYFTGYTGSPLFEYDPGKPWNHQPARPDTHVPLPEEPEANPRLVARMPRMRRAYDVVAGSDGRLYLPCSAEMTGPLASGGGLGWHEPSTGRTGMIREGFEFHRGNAIASACDGRYVVVATTAWWPRHIEPESCGVPDRVVTYDVESGNIIGDLEPWRDSRAGSTLVEWQPGQVLGRFVARCDSEPEALFFLLDVVSQDVVSTHRLAGISSTRLLRMPDGDILGYHDGGIYRLDPGCWSFEPVCKLDAAPRDWCVVDGQVYAFLDTRLVRLDIS